MSDSFLKKHRLQLDDLIDVYFKEDFGSGDLTTRVCLNPQQKSVGKIITREDCMVAGIELSQYIISQHDSSLSFESSFFDGQYIQKGDCLGQLKGSSVSIIQLERLLLNCIARMSAIATNVATLKKSISHTSSQLLDTRKTTPGFRLPEKWAVLIGGGLNHRMGLYDAILIKENHIDLCGGMKNTLEKTFEFISKLHPKPSPIIVEVRNFDELMQTLDFDFIDRILLDNFRPKDIVQAINLIDRKYDIEVSGNINAHNILEYAQQGVDYISMGSLTHSRPLIDLTLLIEVISR
ncbi:MAG: carboxylating nicotinate-nucleotide diphosphorylase [Flavobacteriaceae bacterium]|nr:carboxylating nicotinate-nucleotide diphosphorylase [Flavobacteriaceae bacterium]MCY4267129.1 carboxylating nicotinate-nucleotide diphosphorylase [Flavobacteriaceae bacterium]